MGGVPDVDNVSSEANVGLHSGQRPHSHPHMQSEVQNEEMQHSVAGETWSKCQSKR
jgi:hypothetical protein